MKPLESRTLRVSLTLACVMLISGCASLCTPYASPAAPPEPPQVQPLPQAARQPPLPEICSPTCKEGLTTLRTNLLTDLIGPTSPEKPASGSVTPSKPIPANRD